jgi:hypothetical protein
VNVDAAPTTRALDRAENGLDKWVARALDGPGFVAIGLLALGAVLCPLVIVSALSWQRSHPGVADLLPLLAIAGTVVYGVVSLLLAIPGHWLTERREWARHLLVTVIPPLAAAWIALIACAALVAWQLSTHLGQPHPFVRIPLGGLLLYGVWALILAGHLRSLCRTLRMPEVVAACADEAIWAETLRAWDDWVGDLLSPRRHPLPTGEYGRRPPLRVLALFRPVGLVVTLLPLLVAARWAFPSWGNGWWDHVGISLPLLGDLWSICARQFHEVTAVAWDQEGATLHRRLGRTLHFPWAAVRWAEVVLSPKEGPDTPHPRGALRLHFARRGRPFSLKVDLDDDQGLDLLAAMAGHVELREGEE